VVHCAGEGAVVDHGDPGRGDPFAHQAREGRGLLAVEVALQAVADRLVQQDAGPAGPEHDLHFAGRCVDRVQIDQRHTQGLVDRRPPVVGRHDLGVGDAPAAAVAAALHALALANHDRDVEPHQRPDVGHTLAAGAQDLERLPLAADRGADLAHALVLGAGIGVDLLEQLDLGLEGLEAERIVVPVEQLVGAGGRPGHDAAVAAVHRGHRPGGALDRILGKLAGVGVAGRLARDGAQAEALHGVEAGASQAAVVVGETFGLPVFQEQLAVVGARQGFVHQGLEPLPVEPGAVEEDLVGGGHMAHGGLRRGWRCDEFAP
jgi:hypothetical protein